ncbi:MAG TPA: hypothetical protein VMU95_41280 [Trebonia sp.]|nr:hypothetical protein [Trebonia sp.]
MADELEPINQVVRADLAPYIEEFQRGEDEAKRFAQENSRVDEGLAALAREIKANTAVLREMRDAMLNDAASAKDLKDETDSARDAIDDFALANAGAAEMLGHARDEAIEQGRAMADLRDDAVKASEAEGHLRDEAIEAGEALGHVRDEALEASAAEKELGDSAERAAEKLDLMGVSGLGTFSSLAPLMGVIAAIVVVAAGVAPAVLAAGLGLGAFAGVAVPAVMSVFGALKDTKSQLDALPAGERSVVEGIRGLEGEYTKLANAVKPQVFAMMGTLLTAIKNLMPTLIPLIQQGAIAMGDLVHWLSSGLQSSGFISFMHLMTSLVVPATKAITGLAGALLGALGQSLTQLAPLSVPFIGVITALVKALGGPLAAVLKIAVGLLVGLGQAVEPLLPGLSAFATMVLNGIGSSFQSFIPIIKQVVGLLGGAFLKILTDLAPLIENALTPNSPFMLAFGMLPGLLKAILPAFTWLAGLLAHPMFAQLAVDVISGVIAITELIKVLGLVSKAFGLLGMAFEATPVGWVIGLIAALAFAFYELWNHCAAFRGFWQGLWADIKGILAPVVSWIHNVIDDMARWWTDHGKTVEAIVKTAWLLISSIFKTYLAIVVGVLKTEFAVIEGVFKAVWDVIRIVTETTWKVVSALVTAAIHTVYDVIAAVLDIIEGHWGAAWERIRDLAHTWLNAVVSIIKSITSGFINLLYSAGKDLMQGLVNGIKAAWGMVTGLVGGLGHDISSVFSSALSILSPSRVFFNHGMNTMLGYANGVKAGYQYVRSTMNQVSSAVASTQLGVPASAYGATAGYSGGSSSGGSAGGGSGTITVNVNGQKLFQVMQSELYQYNIRNSGAITGVVKPGLAA